MRLERPRREAEHQSQREGNINPGSSPARILDLTSRIYETLFVFNPDQESQEAGVQVAGCEDRQKNLFLIPGTEDEMSENEITAEIR